MQPVGGNLFVCFAPKANVVIMYACVEVVLTNMCLVVGSKKIKFTISYCSSSLKMR